MEIAVSQIDQLRNFISEITFTDVEKIKEDTLLFEEGIFDSLGFLSLISFLNEDFGIAWIVRIAASLSRGTTLRMTQDEHVSAGHRILHDPGTYGSITLECLDRYANQVIQKRCSYARNRYP